MNSAVCGENPTCSECGKEKVLLKEPIVSGFRGYVCVNSYCGTK